jgi:hypothetical protein
MRRFLLLPAILALTLPATAHAGAWLRPVDESMISARYSHYQSREYYDHDGVLTPQSTFRKHELNVYGEYGLREDWTIGTNLFLNEVSQSGVNNIGLADSEFFARTQIYSSDKAKLALQPLIKLPSWYQKSGTPQSGSDSADGELMLLYGYNLPAFSPRDYLDVGVGYRVRGTSLSNQYRAYVAYGLHLSENLSVVPAVYLTKAASIPDGNNFQQNGDQDYDLTKLDITAFYTLSEATKLYAGFAAEVAGVNTGVGQSVTVGVLRNF